MSFLNSHFLSVKAPHLISFECFVADVRLFLLLGIVTILLMTRGDIFTVNTLYFKVKSINLGKMVMKCWVKW